MKGGCCCGHSTALHPAKDERHDWHRPCEACLCVEFHRETRYHAKGECATSGYGDGVMDMLDTLLPEEVTG